MCTEYATKSDEKAIHGNVPVEKDDVMESKSELIRIPQYQSKGIRQLLHDKMDPQQPLMTNFEIKFFNVGEPVYELKLLLRQPDD